MICSLREISEYKLIIFDCDGVILNSNKVKTKAFYDVVKSYGHENAQNLVNYHVENGGVSRYEKFKYFYTDILRKSPDQKAISHLLECFGRAVEKELINCEVTSGLKLFRKRTQASKWLIISGGDQDELRAVFDKKGLSYLFDGGIFGSPDDKVELFKKKVGRQEYIGRAIYLGDSKGDYLACKKFDVNFLFISAWTEVENWKEWVSMNNIESVSSVGDILH